MQNRERSIPKNPFFLTLLGIVLYWALGVYVRVPTGIADSTVMLRYPVVTLFSVYLGPVYGTLIGFIGQCLVSWQMHQALYMPTIICSGLLGLAMGLSKPKSIRQYTLFCTLWSMVIWALIMPCLNVWMRSFTWKNAFSSGCMNAISNTLTCVIISQVVIASSMKTIVRKIVCVVVVVDAMLLMSYGRTGFGNIVVYLIAIIFAMYEVLSDLLKKGSKSRIRFWIRMILCLTACLFVVAAGFVLINGYSDNTDGSEQAVIVLGAGLDGEEPTPMLKSRLDAALRYAQQYPEMMIIASGGQGADEVISEAEAMYRYLVRQGFPEERILLEDRSTTTEENFAFSRERYPEVERIVYVSNEYHCYRAGMYAGAAGYSDPHQLHTDTSFWSLIPSIFREIPSIIKLGIALVKKN